MSLGSGFVFVTAKHVLGSTAQGDTVFFRKSDGTNEAYKVTVRIDNNEGYDLSIFCVEDRERLYSTFARAITFGDSFIGNDVRSLGFPHGYAGLGKGPSEYAMPLVRGGILSGHVGYGPRTHYIFDGIVSGGNSGGPLITTSPESQIIPNSTEPYILCGIVIEFIPETKDNAAIFNSDTNKMNTQHFITAHSGMSVAVPGIALQRMVAVLEVSHPQFAMKLDRAATAN